MSGEKYEVLSFTTLYMCFGRAEMQHHCQVQVEKSTLD